MNRREAIKRTAILSGYAVSASFITGFLQGCQPSGAPDWEPQFLSPEQGQLVSEMADTIFPTTDTPGAKDVFVHEFMDLMLKDCSDEKTQQAFLSGIAEVDTDAQNAYGKAFAKCSDEQKLELLNSLDQAARAKVKAGLQPGEEAPFILTFKQLTFLGYFTSEAVGTTVLKYDPIPGNYDGCIALDEVGGTWAL